MTSCQGDNGSDVSFDEDASGVTFDYVSRLDCSLQFNDYCGQLNESYTTSIRNQETQTYPETVCSETQTEELNPICIPTEVKTKDTASQTESDEKQINSSGTQVDRPVLTY